MKWQLEWGPQLEALRLAGVDKWKDAPEIPEHLEWAWQAFWDLSASRQVGMAIGAIPFEPIDRYADRYGIADFEGFHRLIRAMDAAFLDHHNRKTETSGN